MPTKASLHGTTPGAGRNTAVLIMNRMTNATVSPTEYHPSRVLGSETDIMQILFSSHAALAHEALHLY
jgi:hypothetical protein